MAGQFWCPGSTQADWKKIQGLLIQPLLSISGLPTSTGHTELLSTYGLCELQEYFKVDLANFISCLFSPTAAPEAPAIDPYLVSFYQLLVLPTQSFRQSMAFYLCHCISSGWRSILPRLSLNHKVEVPSNSTAQEGLELLVMRPSARQFSQARSSQSRSRFRADLHAKLQPHFQSLFSYFHSAKLALKRGIHLCKPSTLVRFGTVLEAGTLLRFSLESFYLFPGVPHSCRLSSSCPLCKSSSLSLPLPPALPGLFHQLHQAARSASFRLSHHLLLQCPHHSISSSRLTYLSFIPPSPSIFLLPESPEFSDYARDISISLFLGLCDEPRFGAPARSPSSLRQQWEAALVFLGCALHALQYDEQQ